MQIPYGFLQEVTEVLCKKYPRLSKDFLFSIAEVLLSSACWNIFVIDSYSELTPNIWIQMIAPSGDGKTLPIDKFIVLILDELEKLLETEETIYKLHIQDYTKEAIQRHFSGRTKRKGKDEKKSKQVIYIYGILYKDEASTLLQGAAKKSYLADIAGVESKMYDGTIGRKLTAKRGLEETRDGCFKANIAASTTDIYRVVNIGAFVQGWWNRYDMVIGNPIDPKNVPLLDEDFFLPNEDISEFEELPMKYAQKLKDNLIDSGKVRVMVIEEASRMWREYEREMKIEVAKLPDSDLRRGYLNRQAEKALKRAMLYEVSCMFDNLKNMEPTSYVDKKYIARTEKIIPIREENMEKAIANQREYYKYWLKMLDDRSKFPVESTPHNDAADMAVFEANCQALTREFDDGIFSRALLIDRIKKLESNLSLPGLIASYIIMGKLKVYHGDDSRLICNKHMNAKDDDWFERQMINKSFKTAPHLYKYFEKGGSVVDDS